MWHQYILHDDDIHGIIIIPIYHAYMYYSVIIIIILDVYWDSLR